MNWPGATMKTLQTIIRINQQMDINSNMACMSWHVFDMQSVVHESARPDMS